MNNIWLKVDKSTTQSGELGTYRQHPLTTPPTSTLPSRGGVHPPLPGRPPGPQAGEPLAGPRDEHQDSALAYPPLLSPAHSSNTCTCTVGLLLHAYKASVCLAILKKIHKSAGSEVQPSLKFKHREVPLTPNGRASAFVDVLERGF